MINKVRNIVLTILNKENRGYITPEQFNQYADHAQHLVFDNMFAEYANMMQFKDARKQANSFGDRAAIDRYNIEDFIVTTTTPADNSLYAKPTNLYHLLRINMDDDDTLLEHLSSHKRYYIENNSVAGPSEMFPYYIEEGKKFKIIPDTMNGDIKVTYIRRPSEPKWTYTTVGESPVYNPTASDHQDFEVAHEYQTQLTVEILKLAGLTIGEAAITQAAVALDREEEQKDFR